MGSKALSAVLNLTIRGRQCAKDILSHSHSITVCVMVIRQTEIHIGCEVRADN